MPDNRTYDRSADEIQWGDEIPFDGEVLPAADPDALVRPLTAANKWRRQFSGDGAGRDGSPEWYEQNGAPERRPEQATIDYVMSLR